MSLLNHHYMEVVPALVLHLTSAHRMAVADACSAAAVRLAAATPMINLKQPAHCDLLHLSSTSLHQAAGQRWGRARAEAGGRAL